MSRSRGSAVTVFLALALALGAVAVPVSAASSGLGETTVAPSTVATGTTTTLDLSVNATGVNTTDGTTGANVTVAVPAALDLSGATATGSATPNATGVTASVDATANAVVVSWDDAGGAGGETLSVNASVSGVAVDRTGDHALTATVDADGDATTDASGTVGTVTASATDSDRSVTAADSVLYLGEEDVDLTGLDGAAPAGDSQRFYGVGGAAEGAGASADDAVAVDVTRARGFVPGTYSLDVGGDTDFVVQRPNVTEVRLYPGESASGTEVAGSSIPTTVETLTVEPRFDFGASENATVIVEDETGLTRTDELATDATVSSSGETVRLDVSDLPVGTYTVRVEGTDDLDDVNATATIRVRESARTVSLSRTRVVRGDSTVATVSGRPGAVRYVRLQADALDDETVNVPTAKAVFGAADGLVFVGADDQAAVLYAVVALDEEGFARVELDTDPLDTGTHDVAVARNATADVASSVPVAVTARRVTASPARASVAVGETVTVSGTARGADAVKLYADVGGTYAPLYTDADATDLAEPRVAGDGDWSVDVDTGAVLSVSGEYRIVAVADPGDDYLGSTARIDESTRRGFEDVATATLMTTDPSPSASVSRARVATGTGDEVRVTGRAPGPAERVRGYVVTPRGAITPFDVAVSDDDAFDFEYAAFDAAGQYRVLVVSPGRDGTFGYADGGAAATVRRELDGAETATGTRAILRDAYGGAGVDDRIVELNVTATAPEVRVETVTRRDGTLLVTGTTNRENGTHVGLDLWQGSSVVAVADAEANASGRFRASFDVSDLDAGRYDLRAETGETRDVRPVRLGTQSTPESATPPPTGTGTPTADATSTTPAADDRPVADETRRATDRESRTETTGDGFGPVTAAVVAVAALLVAAGRRRS